MPRVYQRADAGRRARRASFAGTQALVLVAFSSWLSACGTDAAPPPARETPRSVALDAILDSKSYELVGALESPARLVANEISTRGTHAIAVAAAGGAVSPLASEGESFALAALPDGQVLLETRTGDVRRLELVGPGSRRIVLTAAGIGRERFLSLADDSHRFFSVARESAEGPERLIETRLPGGQRRALDSIPPPFSLAAVSGGATTLALRRAIHDDADEIVLLDRQTGEMHLLLPDDEEGRFRPLAFLGDDRFLLLLADDGGERARLELLTLATGERRVVGDFDASAPECEPSAAQRVGGAALRVDLLCRGLRESRRLELSGRAAPLPPPLASLPLASFLPLDESGAMALGLEGLVSTDLCSWTQPDGLRPLTYGLAPALGAAPFARREAVTIGEARLPGELWARAEPTLAGLVWLEDGSRLPRWDELPPTLVALVHRGIVVLRVRARGAEGFGRGLRSAAAGDPGGALLEDLSAASRFLAQRLPSAAPLALVAEGGWEGAAALVEAGDESSGVRAVAALYPDPDPFARLDGIASAREPARTWLLARWGDPAAPGAAERRARWRLPVGAARLPLFLAFEPSLGSAPPVVATIEAARAASLPIAVALEPRPEAGAGWSRELAPRLVDFLERHLFEPAEPATH